MSAPLVPIGATYYVDALTHNPTTGAISNADSTPTFDVYENGSTTGQFGATNMIQRASLTGDYYATFTVSASTPTFVAGRFYNVIATATVGGVTAKKNCGYFRVAPQESQAGVPKIDLAYWLGTAALLVGSLPSVNTTTISNAIIAGATFAASALTAIADALLDRDMSVGTDSGSSTVRTPRQALRFIRNLWTISGPTLTVYKENDSTPSWTGTVTQTAGNPVSSIDPAGP